MLIINLLLFTNLKTNLKVTTKTTTVLEQIRYTYHILGIFYYFLILIFYNLNVIRTSSVDTILSAVIIVFVIFII